MLFKSAHFKRILSIRCRIEYFYFWSSAVGKFQVEYNTKALLSYNGDISWMPPAIFKSSCSIDVTYFPFDTQVSMVESSFMVSMVDLIHLQFISLTPTVCGVSKRKKQLYQFYAYLQLLRQFSTRTRIIFARKLRTNQKNLTLDQTKYLRTKIILYFQHYFNLHNNMIMMHVIKIAGAQSFKVRRTRCQAKIVLLNVTSFNSQRGKQLVKDGNEKSFRNLGAKRTNN